MYLVGAGSSRIRPSIPETCPQSTSSIVWTLLTLTVSHANLDTHLSLGSLPSTTIEYCLDTHLIGGFTML